VNISAFIPPATGAGALLSPQECKKKLLDFSSGVVSHVKSYYNESLFPKPGTKSEAAPATAAVSPPVLPNESDTAATAVTAKPPANDDYDVIIANNNNEAADKNIQFPPSAAEQEPSLPPPPDTSVPAPADSASTDNLPPGVLYKVKATYKYQAEDMDELAFEVGEMIQVVEYDDPEEQEEGWLMGVKESTGQKGLFPANFTKPI